MADLSVEQVKGLLVARGFVVTEEDAVEATHRVNAISDALEALEDPALDTVEPLPVFWLREGK